MGRIPGPVRWYGGKAHQLSWLLERLPKCNVYVEPFGGAGSVLLNARPAQVLVYNDLDGRLVNLMRVLQQTDLYDQLAHRLLHTSYSRAEFVKALGLVKTHSALGSIDSVEYAWAFFVAQNQGFGGVAEYEGRWGRSFTATNGTAQTVQGWLKRIQMLPEWHQRLRRIQVDYCDALQCIRYWDGPDTGYYLDPPYVHETRKSIKDYAHEQPIEFHAELVQVLLGIQGQATLSCYWNNVYEPLTAAGWQRIDVPHYYQFGQSHTKQQR